MPEEGEKDSSSQDAGSDPYAPLLDHAVRQWKAEEENSRRHAKRVNLLLTVVAAFFGLGLFRVIQGPVYPIWLFALVLALLALGLGLLAVGSLYLLRVLPRGSEEVEDEVLKREHEEDDASFQSGRPPPASLYLRLPLGVYKNLPDPTNDPGTPSYVRFFSFITTSAAADDLAKQNVAEERRIDTGQQWIVLGFTCILLAIPIYSCGTEEPFGQDRPERTVDTSPMEDQNGQGIQTEARR